MILVRESLLLPGFASHNNNIFFQRNGICKSKATSCDDDENELKQSMVQVIFLFVFEHLVYAQCKVRSS